MYKNKIKLIVVGAPKVGKTSLLEQFAERLDTIDASGKISESTIGVGFFTYQYQMEIYSKKYDFQIWDIVEDEKFDSIRPKYYNGAAAAFLIFDLTKPDTFDYVTKYLEILRKKIKSRYPFVLIGNKLDLVKDENTIDRDKYREYVEKEGLINYIETSTNNAERIVESIGEIIQMLLEIGLIEASGKDLNLKILLALNIYNELSLPELASYLNKSKSTVSRNTRYLMKIGLIESREEEQKQAGSIKRKYYRLSQEFGYLPEKVDTKSFDFKNGKSLMNMRIELRKQIYVLSLYEQLTKSLNNFLRIVPRDRWGLTQLWQHSLPESKSAQNIRFVVDTFFKTKLNLRFLTEKQYEKLLLLRTKFHSELNKILEKDDGTRKENVFFDMVLPIFNLIELEDPRYKKVFDKVKERAKIIDTEILKRSEE